MIRKMSRDVRHDNLYDRAVPASEDDDNDDDDEDDDDDDYEDSSVDEDQMSRNVASWA